MGCKPLPNNFFYPLEIIHSKKSACAEKKRINYYPFGLKHKGYNNVVSSNGNSVANKFGFGGKELSEELGLNTMDFGARNYDASLGRWFNIDPLAEFMRSQSPYNYGFNNPIYFSDYAGTIPWPLPEFFRNWRRKRTPDSHFRTPRRRRHNGLDLNYNGGGNTDHGAPIVATHSGTVARIIPLGARDGGGRIVVISSPDGSFETKYMHLSSVTVEAGDEISEGQTIGLMGRSGFGQDTYSGYKSHLHYEIHQRNDQGVYEAINPWQNGTLIDPQEWVNETELEWSFDIYITNFLKKPKAKKLKGVKAKGVASTSVTPSVDIIPTKLYVIAPTPLNYIPVTPLSPGTTIITPSVTPTPPPPPINVQPSPECLDC